MAENAPEVQKVTIEETLQTEEAAAEDLSKIEEPWRFVCQLPKVKEAAAEENCGGGCVKG